jgi:hypothetical protein
LISWLTYISSLAAEGRGLKKPIPMSDLLPDYLGERNKKKPEAAAKTAEEQRQEMRSWFAMYQRKLAEARGQKP